MNYNYIFTRSSSSELTHAGIKGQKWGVRRFQNEDGSLTPAGKDRYGYGDNSKIESKYKRGRAYQKEYNSVRDQELEKSKQKSVAYQLVDKEQKRLNNKYGFEKDENDPFDMDRSDHNDYNPYERAKARDRYYTLKLTRDAMESSFNDRATKQAGEHMTRKYGDTYVKDINHYNRRKAVGVLAVAAAIPVAVILGARR